MILVYIISCVILGWFFGIVQSAVYKLYKRNKFSIKNVISDSIGFIIGWLIITIIRGTYSNILYLVFFLIGYGVGEYYCYITNKKDRKG